MEKLYQIAAICGLAVAVFSLVWYTVADPRKRDEENDEVEDDSAVAAWHVTHKLTNTSFNFIGTYDQAITELRRRVVDATIVHVDYEWHVIIFDFPAKK